MARKITRKQFRSICACAVIGAIITVFAACAREDAVIAVPVQSTAAVYETAPDRRAFIQNAEAQWNGGAPIVDVWALGDVSMMLDADGYLWAWGTNAGCLMGDGTEWVGMVGDGTQENRLTPVLIMDSVAAVHSGGGSPLALRRDNSLWRWSSTDNLPVQIEESVASVVGYHRAVILTDGSVWLWRWGGDPVQLDVDLSAYLPLPPLIPHPPSDYTLLPDGSLWGWSLPWSRGEPVLVMDSVQFVVSSGQLTYAIRTGNTLWWWRSQHADRSEPEQILDSVTALHRGRDSFDGGPSGAVFAVKTDGSAWLMTMTQHWLVSPGTPERLRGSAAHIVEQASSHHGEGPHGFALQTDGELWAWNSDWGREAWMRGEDDWNTRDYDNHFFVMDSVASAYMGAGRVYAIRTNGTLWVWRWWDREGGPAQVMDSVASVHPGLRLNRYSGGSHVLAVREDGSLWSWGGNRAGQLGDGTTESRTTPAQIREAAAR